jgi:hypothetical protein
VSPSPSDRTVAFLRGRYQRHPGAAIGIGLSVLWAIWVIYYIADHRDNVDSFGWFPLVAQAVGEIGSGVLLAAGVVWLVGLVFDPR